MKIKIQCPCGKRLLVLSSDIGQKRECPRCKENIQVPTLSSGQILAIFCECNTEITSLACASCQKQYPELELYLRAKSSLPSQKTESTENEIPQHNPTSSHSITLNKEAFSVKFQCSCGKRITALATAIGKENFCKLCNRRIVVPTFQEEGFLGFLCKCETLLDGQQDQCPVCETPLYISDEILPISPPPSVVLTSSTVPVTSSNLPEIATDSSSLKSSDVPTPSSIKLLLKLAGISLLSSFVGLLLFLHVVDIYKLPLFREPQNRFNEEYQQKLLADQKFQEDLKKASQIPKPENPPETKESNTSVTPKTTSLDPETKETEENSEKATEQKIDELMKELFEMKPQTTAIENVEKNTPVLTQIPTTTKLTEASPERELEPMSEVTLHLVEGLDFEFFKERVQPILAANCSSELIWALALSILW